MRARPLPWISKPAHWARPVQLTAQLTGDDARSIRHAEQCDLFCGLEFGLQNG
jgi:hypothetical protein